MIRRRLLSFLAVGLVFAASCSDKSLPTQSPPPSTPGSLVEMTVQVNSYSTDSLDSSLFEIPASFTMVQPPNALTPGAAPAAGNKK